MAAKDKKKGKLSKAQKEKLKKEKAEQKSQEEEDAKIHAQQQQIEREEREHQEREERRIFEEQERVRHQAEIDELSTQVEENKQYLIDLKTCINEKNKWNRYMLCDGRPNLADKKDINTFINLWREDATGLDFEKVLRKSGLVLELLDELHGNIEDLSPTLSSESVEASVNMKEEILCSSIKKSYQQSIKCLQALIWTKTDEATYRILKSPDNNIDPDTLNISHISKSEHIKLCLWGNSAKNPRIRHVEFDNGLFKMELPKQMALADIAFRVVFAKFDFLSPECSTYAMKRRNINSIKTSEAQVNLHEKEKENRKEDGITRSPLVPSTNNLLGVKDIMMNKSRSSMTRASRVETVELSAESASIDNSMTQKESPELCDDDFLEEDVVDLRSYAPTGSLVYIELLKLPPQAKEVKGWIIQEVQCCGLQRLSYGESNSQQNSSSLRESPLNTSSGVEAVTSAVGYNLPIAFSFRVDETTIFHEVPQIARWDDLSQHWRTHGIIDFTYDRGENMMFFRSAYFGPFAVMQDIYLNMPFQCWQLRPTSLNECILNIMGSETEVDIIVKEGKCCVKFPTSLKQLEYITLKWMTPKELINKLRSIGINLFPYEDGEKYVSICKKPDKLIKPLHQHMALSASAFSYAWSKWNNQCGEDQVVVQATEWMESSRPDHDSYNLYMASTRICCKLKTIELCEEFSTDVHPEWQMHPDLYNMLRDGASEKAKQRLKDSSVVFIDCVQQLLNATNLFVYS